MRLILILPVLFCLPLWGRDKVPVAVDQKAEIDTLWVLRSKADKSINLIMLPGWKFETIDSEKKVNIACATLVRDSVGNLVKLAYRTRLFGVDTSKLELRYTTEDSIPADYGLFRYKLDGKFERIQENNHAVTNEEKR